MCKQIYIADDDFHIREIVQGFLCKQGYKAKTFENGDLLLEEFIVNPCDLVILDIMMDGTDGITICSQFRAVCDVPIILLSALDSELDRVSGLISGGDDYLTKPFSPLELVTRVNSIFRRIELDRSSQKKNTLLSYGTLELDLLSHQCTIAGKNINLSPTEHLLLRYLISNADRAVSREELLKNVWHIDVELETRAVDDVVKRLRKKLSVSNVTIDTVWGFGFKLQERPAT